MILMLSFLYCLIYFSSSQIRFTLMETSSFKVFCISSSLLFPSVAKIRNIGAVLGIQNLNMSFPLNSVSAEV